MQRTILSLILCIGLVAAWPLAAQVAQGDGDPLVEQTELSVDEPTPPDVEVSAEADIDAPEAPPEPTEEADELPRTAGALPLLVLIGGSAAGAGLGLRRARRK